MLIKTDRDAIQSFLSDSSYMNEGQADRVVFPETAEEVADVLRGATRERTPVTISGAGTGTVGGRVPSSGVVLSTDKLNRIKSMARDEQGGGGRAVAEAGVRLTDLQKFVETEGFLYAPDPTERSCYLGGTIATNASGARTFKYGPTRNHVMRLKIALANGEVIDIRRGELSAAPDGLITVPLASGELIEAQLPTYHMPQTRKHAAGYFVAPGMDVVDLFIGSEGTLGVVIEAEVALVPKPQGLLSGVVFFDSEAFLLLFVGEARRLSLENRQDKGPGVLGALIEKALKLTDRQPTRQVSENASPRRELDARALEYFDSESLDFLRTKYTTVPANAVGAIFFEQETTPETEDALMNEWQELVEHHEALADDSWFATNETDHARLREFRHALPVLMNEWFSRHNQRKVSTDMSVPDEAFPGMLRFYKETLRETSLRHTVFGHIGDNHVHVNILPRDDNEASIAKEIYVSFVKRAVEVGGTISAEHGIGKLKREYLGFLYSEEHLREMAALKRAFDPAGILGRGNIFSEEYL
ncbi:MAG TPA: FAD-binding oxidoreductase [Pyrinomonadaceae bacterium]|nr:FAD-binding oxidoreductase [Pyrinomonadaceae bacterium]